MLTGDSNSSFSSALIISKYKPSFQNNSADDDTFRFSFASDFSEDLPLPFAILGLFSYKRCTPDTFRGGGHFKFFISILALHFEIAGVCRGNMFHHPLINLYMSTPDLSQQSLYLQHRKFKIAGVCQRKFFLYYNLSHSFTFYGTAFPEPTTIGPQPDTAGRNLTSAIIGTYKLYHLPEISNCSDTFGNTNDCPTAKSSMFISAVTK